MLEHLHLKELQEKGISGNIIKDNPTNKIKKKLLIATDSFLPRWDGITRFLTEIIPRLKDNYEITVIAPEFPGELKWAEIEHIKFIRFPILNFNFGDINFSWFHYSKIKKIVEEQDIVFSQTIGPIGICAIKSAKKLKKPVICYIHSIEWELATRSIDSLKLLINLAMKSLVKHYYNKVDLLLVPSMEVGELYKRNGIAPPYKIVHLGTDTNKFVPAKDEEYKNRIREALGITQLNSEQKLNSNQIIIGFSGRIGREKNLVTLYRAFRKIEKKYENIKLLIIGKGVKDLEEMFTSQRNIIMPGAVNNVVPYLQAMDIFVLPSLTETSSLATMEAMSCGIPIVTTPVGYVKDYIKEKENGLFFPFKNSLVLSMKLEILIKDKELREKLGRNARKTIIERFSWENTVGKIKENLSKF
ncbi:glycosyltransferase family 4 protein [Candidatus Woesearchaeota archaeon]|nr:glycosyltransferase family 4 protein [Candidatus Woesearchaeota archaeon]